MLNLSAEKKVAIMQPYLFPYLGYFQLIELVDTFVFYDDVNFIKQGWINRNRILVSTKPMYFTVPLANASSNSKIRDTLIHKNLFEKWKVKFLRTLVQSYSKAPYVIPVKALVENVFYDKNASSIGDLAKGSIVEVRNYLGLTNTTIIESSFKYGNSHLSGEKRVVDIVKAESGNRYINPIGGLELYKKQHFADEGLFLSFLQSRATPYDQFIDSSFIPNLSILDMLMFNSKDTVKSMLAEFELL